MCRAETTDHNFCGRDTAQLCLEVRPMKYHISISRPATPDNWRIMLRAFATNPRKLAEASFQAILDAAGTAQILHNRRDELLAFLDSCWDPSFCHRFNPVFETHEPHHFYLLRQRWEVTITLAYWDRTGTGIVRENRMNDSIDLTIRAKNPEVVRKFAHLAAAAIVGEQKWTGALHLDNNRATGNDQGSIDQIIDALIQVANEEAAATA